MKIFGRIEKVEPQDDGTIKVHGIASTEQVDDQGEIVQAAAMRAALPDYMKFPAVREMHQLQAAGTALEADVGDDGATRIVAHVIDPVAVSKVKHQVYRGFSIGGRVTKREPGNPKTITGLVLNEISLVDRPANPEAIFDCWKASGMTTEPQATAAPFNAPFQIWACGIEGHRHLAKADAAQCLDTQKVAGGTSTAAIEAVVAAANETQTTIDAARKAIETAGGALAQAQATEPVEKKDGGKPKGDYGSVTYADLGYQSDKKPRYPIDSERHIRAAWSRINQGKNAAKYTAEQVKSMKGKIVAAWKEKIDKDGPPSAAKSSEAEDLAKAIFDVGRVASMIFDLRSLRESLAIEAIIENDDSGLSAQVAAICEQACRLLVALVAEETSEILDGTEIVAPVAALAPLMLSVMTESLRKEISDQPRAEALVEHLNQVTKVGRRHNKADQALLDEAALQCTKAMNSADCSKGDGMGYNAVRKYVLDAGATDLNADGREMVDGDDVPDNGAASATEESTTDTRDNAETSTPNPTGAVPAKPVPGEAQQGSQKASMSQDVGDDIARAAARLTTAGVPGSVVMDLVGIAGGIAKAGMKKSHVHGFLQHVCMKAFSDGASCDDAMASPTRHNKADMANIHEAHKRLLKCDGMAMACKAFNLVPGGMPTTAGESEGQGTASSAGVAGDRGQPGKDAAAGGGDDLQKLLADERAEKSALVKTLGEMVPMMAEMSELLKAFGQLPQAARAIRYVVPGTSTGITKAADNRGPENGNGTASITIDQLAEFAKKSPQEQALYLTKLARSTPAAIQPEIGALMPAEPGTVAERSAEEARIAAYRAGAGIRV